MIRLRLRVSSEKSLAGFGEIGNSFLESYDYDHESIRCQGGGFRPVGFWILGADVLRQASPPSIQKLQYRPRLGLLDRLIVKVVVGGSHRSREPIFSNGTID